MSDKIKSKIEKLLNLSMSDNENESAVALKKALKLMNEHNITKDEIYKQKMISKCFEVDCYRLPDWTVKIYSYMSELSGCVFTWRNGNGFFKRKVKGRFTGRERDVENAIYLSDFIKKEVEKKAKKYKAEIDKVYSDKYKRIVMKSYKKGIVQAVSSKLFLKQNEFFNEQTKGTDLVCMDRESRIKDAQAFLEELLGKKTKDHKSQAKYEKQGFRDGISDGSNIEINQAVAKQEEFKLIGA